MSARALGRAATFGFALAIAAGLVPVAIGPVAAQKPVSSSEADADAACAPVPAGVARCFAMVSRKGAKPNSLVTPNAAPDGFAPADLASAYALPTGGTEGSGITVAVVDAYDQPNAEANLATYRTQFGLPACTTANGCFTKVKMPGPQGQDPPDGTASGWAMEIDLDIQMVSAVCPNCRILLVEAYSPNLTDIAAAENAAVDHGAKVVSNSFGSAEAYSEVSLDPAFNHPGVAIVASSGDCGYNCAPAGGRTVEYPAASQYVVAVGGTSLVKDGSARGWTAQVWGPSGPGDSTGAGSGCSLFEAKPIWQTDPTCTNRMVSDVSAVADPNTGVAVNYNGTWGVFGGTSAAAPIVAGIYGLVGGVPAGQYPGRYLYEQASSLNDVVGGNNDALGTCTVTYYCNGVAGYDGPTGLGTPKGLAAFTPAPPAPVTLSTYNPVTTTRLLDTRNGIGLSGAFQSKHARTFTVTGVLVPTDATAVTGNLTVTKQSAKGYLYIGPQPLDSPGSSTLNFPVGDDRANNVTVPLGIQSVNGAQMGTLSVTYVAGSYGPTAHVIFDVTGYFTPTQDGSTYHPVDPTRILDTRSNVGLVGAVRSMSPRPLTVWGVGGVPTGAVAITGNLTVTKQTARGFLYVGPDSSAKPPSSTLNFPVGDDRANGFTAKLTPDGKLFVDYVASSYGQSAQVIIDLTGYYTQGVSGLSYVPVVPRRILDTRYGVGLGGPFPSMAHRVFGVTSSDVPVSALAVTGNLTVTGQSARGFVYVGPQQTDHPGSSTLNFPRGDARANGVTVATNGGGLSATYVASAYGQYTQVIFDLSGYFRK